MNETLPTFLDFEASSLSDVSYPIEVAWSLPSGDIESYLIRPTWDWNDWDYNAEALHGLSREQITKEGLPAWTVAERLNAALSGSVAYSDAPDYETFWMERLFEHHREDRQFEIRHFDTLFPTMSPETIMAKMQIARYRTPGRQHRAGSDVQFLIELYKLLRAEP